MHRLRLFLTAAVFSLLAAQVPFLHAQAPLPGPDLGRLFEPISITKDFSYQQTGAATVIDYEPSLTIAYKYFGTPPSDLRVQAVIGESTVTLEKSSVTEDLRLAGLTGLQTSHTTFSYRQIFRDNSSLGQAFANTFITLNSTTNGATTSTRVFVTTSSPVTPFRVVNFDALQAWDGGDFSVIWNPISGLNSETAPRLSIHRAIEPTSPIFSLPVAVTTTVTATGGSFGAPIVVTTTYHVPNSLSPSGITSTPGEILHGTLSRSFPANSGFTANVQTTSLRFPIKRPAPAPLITTQPQSLTATIGTTATISPTITATGATYIWQKDGTTITGATTATLTFRSVQATDAGTYTVTATNSGGSVTSNAATLTIVAATVVPTITTAPAAITVLAGAKSTFTVAAAGTAPFTYQWLRNGATISGATNSSLTLDATLPSDAAAYTVTITNSAGSVTSPAATLGVTPISRISNLSVLTSISSATDSFTLGYVVGGIATTGSKPLLLRAVGPALGALGVGGTLDDPKLELFAGSTKTAENDNWGGSAPSISTLTSAFTAVGAFPFPSPTSHDAAVTTSLTTRDNSVKISAANESTGLVIAEVYDATPSANFITTTPRLLNVSVLKSLGTGLTVGFTVAGSTPKTVLIRAIGPTLGDFGVPGTVADPQLVLFNSASVKINENDNWGGTPALTGAFTSVGAFALPATSKDAALLATLQPGGYSVQVTGVADSTGAALVEVYEVP